MKLKESKLEKRLNCEGFIGFGSGYGIGKHWFSKDGAVYCNLCPLKVQCWRKHKARVGRLLPALTEEFEVMAARLNGPELLRQWQAKYNVSDPYTLTLVSNMEDGQRVAEGLQPIDRGDMRLTWPLQERIQ